MRTLKDEINELKRDISNVLAIPGGREMLMTYAAEQMGQSGGTKQLVLYDMGEDPPAFRKGGLVNYAELVRRGGRGDDEVLLHVSPEEFEALVAMWGPPDINPITGLPEYGFLSKLWKGIKHTVKKIVKSPLFSFLAPIALNVFAPGLGSAIGGALGLGGKTASIVGNTLLRSGIGAASGGKEGALAGAVSGLTMGGAGKALGAKLGLEGNAARFAGDALIGGAGSKLAGGDFASGALGQIQASMIQPQLEDATSGVLKKIFKPGGIGEGVGTPMPSEMSTPGSFDPDIYSAATDDDGGIFGGVMDWAKEHPWLAAGAGAALIGGMGGSPEEAQQPRLPDEFYEPLQPVDFERSISGPADYYTYGQLGAPQQGEYQFFDRNNIGTVGGQQPPLVGQDITSPLAGRERELLRRYMATQLPPMFADGGHTRGPGSGRDDLIDARLSDGEYVMDAETVSLLGDGSNDEGARRLDQMREELRRHKGRALAKGKFSPDAKLPMAYLKKGGTVSRKEAKDIAQGVMNKHLRTKPPKGHGLKKARGGRIRRKMLVRHMVEEAMRGE